jgi:hypothetical protein
MLGDAGHLDEIGQTSNPRNESFLLLFFTKKKRLSFLRGRPANPARQMFFFEKRTKKLSSIK